MADAMRIDGMQDTSFLYLKRDAALNFGPKKWKNQSAVPDARKFDAYVSPMIENFKLLISSRLLTSISAFATTTSQM